MAYGTTQADGYTAGGLRAYETVSGTTTFFVYDGDTQLSGLTTSGALTDLDTFGINGLISCQIGSNSVHYVYDPLGSMAQRMISSSTIWGDGMTDAYGSVLGSSSTDPFSGYGSEWGYYMDSETGLSLLGHRFYDEAQGRFINRDPIGYGGGIGLYGFVGDEPVCSADPDGWAPRTGDTGGQVINQSCSSIPVVFDTFSNGKRTEWMGVVPPHMKTNPKNVDVDMVPGPGFGFPWRHIPGYHGGKGSTIFFNGLFGTIGVGFGYPVLSDKTGWPSGYGNDVRRYMTAKQMQKNHYISAI